MNLCRDTWGSGRFADDPRITVRIRQIPNNHDDTRYRNIPNIREDRAVIGRPFGSPRSTFGGLRRIGRKSRLNDVPRDEYIEGIQR